MDIALDTLVHTFFAQLPVKIDQYEGCISSVFDAPKSMILSNLCHCPGFHTFRRDIVLSLDLLLGNLYSV